MSIRHVNILNRTQEPVVVGVTDIGSGDPDKYGQTTVEPRPTTPTQVNFSGAGRPQTYKVCFIGLSGAQIDNSAAWIWVPEVVPGSTVVLACHTQREGETSDE